MRAPRVPALLPAVLAISAGCSRCALPPAPPQPADGGPVSAVDELDVLTQHNDNVRTGRAYETVLTPRNVATNLAKLWSLSVGGPPYAQPLYVHQLSTPSGPRNVLYVATAGNTVHAFDADAPGPAIWTATLGPPVQTRELQKDIGTPIGEGGCNDNVGETGITSTPVIDRAAGKIFVVAKSKESGVYHQRIHALDLVTGQEDMVRAPPAELKATVTKTRAGGGGSVDSAIITFDPKMQLNRPALTLTNGIILVGFGSHCDIEPYHGWVFAVDEATLATRSAFVTTFQAAGGIWQSGNGFAIDPEGYAYAMTGNGSDDTGDWTSDASESFIKLQIESGSLRLVDRFTPYNHAYLNQTDSDLGSSGPLLIPNSFYILGAGKEGNAYVLDRRNLGGIQSGSNNDVQEVQVDVPPSTDGYCSPDPKGMSAGYCRHVHGSPVFWDETSEFYVWGEDDHPKAFFVDRSGRKPPITPGPVSATMPPLSSMPGGILSLSAPRGAKTGGILWATIPIMGDANDTLVPGQVIAFDASTMVSIWSSGWALGRLMKFEPPTIANGKVYVGSYDWTIQVFGLGCTPNPCGERRCGQASDNCGHSVSCGPECPPPPAGCQSGQIACTCREVRYCTDSATCPPCLPPSPPHHPQPVSSAGHP